MLSLTEASSTRTVIGPYGEVLTLDALPKPGPMRWVPRRKAQVVAAVQGGMLSVEEACERYSISLDEFNSWQVALAQGGLKALRSYSIRWASFPK